VAPAARLDHGKLEIVGAPQRTSIGGRQQVAGPYADGGGETGRVDVAHEQSGERRQPDGASPLERHRGAVDGEPEPRHETADRTGVLERVQELAEQPAEVAALFFGQAGEQAVRVGQVLGRARLEQLASRVGEGDQRAPAVVGVGLAVGEASPDQPVDPEADRARGQAQLRREASLRDAVASEPDERGELEMDSLSDPQDPSRWSAEDLITMGFVNTPELTAVLENTPKLADLDLDEYDAIMVAGGQSPMFTFREDEDLKSAIRHSTRPRSRPRCTATAPRRSSI